MIIVINSFEDKAQNGKDKNNNKFYKTAGAEKIYERKEYIISQKRLYSIQYQKEI